LCHRQRPTLFGPEVFCVEVHLDPYGDRGVGELRWRSHANFGIHRPVRVYSLDHWSCCWNRAALSYGIAWHCRVGAARRSARQGCGSGAGLPKAWRPSARSRPSSDASYGTSCGKGSRSLVDLGGFRDTVRRDSVGRFAACVRTILDRLLGYCGLRLSHVQFRVGRLAEGSWLCGFGTMDSATAVSSDLRAAASHLG